MADAAPRRGGGISSEILTRRGAVESNPSDRCSKGPFMSTLRLERSLAAMTLAALLTLFLLPAASWAQDATETATPPKTVTDEAPATEEAAVPIERTIDYSINSIMLLVCG